MTMQRLKNEDVEIANEDVEIASEGAEIFVELNLENKKDESESILSEFHEYYMNFFDDLSNYCAPYNKTL